MVLFVLVLSLDPATPPPGTCFLGSQEPPPPASPLCIPGFSLSTPFTGSSSSTCPAFSPQTFLSALAPQTFSSKPIASNTLYVLMMLRCLFSDLIGPLNSRLIYPAACTASSQGGLKDLQGNIHKAQLLTFLPSLPHPFFSIPGDVTCIPQMPRPKVWESFLTPLFRSPSISNPSANSCLLYF